MLETVNPATGEVLATFPVDGRREVEAAVARAHEAAAWWAGLDWSGRRIRLLAWKSHLTRYLGRLAQLVHEETGKPLDDATLEIILAIVHIDWAARHARRVLRPRRVRSGLAAVNQASTVEYQPLGVVGVIGPWNYPVFTPCGSIAYALAAGNAVVFKPSEYTPGVGQWLADKFTEVVGGRPVFQVVTGFGETGNALCTAAVNKLAFTGSGATGKKVMAACAENLTPVLIEAGGKDSLIVDEDADLTRAAEAALWGGMSNAGQMCTGTERVYVHEKVFDAFINEITSQAKDLHAGPDGKIGPITMPSQLGIIKSHIDDAIAKGASVVLGGADAIGERFVQPTILTHVPEDSTEITDETFGPTLAINPVENMDEAVKLTNATKYGLAGAVFAKKNGVAIARRVRSGMTSVNSVVAFAAVPALPFGGVGQSGFGRIHGPDGLKEFTFAKAITRQRLKPIMQLTSFARDAKTDGKVALMMMVLHGGNKTLK